MEPNRSIHWIANLANEADEMMIVPNDVRDLRPIYERVKQNLLNKKDHVARVIGGAACEQWFNAEGFASLNWTEPPILPPEYCALAENRKRDLCIKDLQGYVVATIESKVGYNNKNLWTSLRELAAQTTRNSLDDETCECQRAAMVYLVWGDYFTRRDIALESDFLAAATREMAVLFPASLYEHIPHGGVDTIVEMTELSWPTGTYRVSLHTCFIQCSR